MVRYRVFLRRLNFLCAGVILPVFLVVGTASAQTVRTIFSFGWFGSHPPDAPVQGRDGQLYGTTFNGFISNGCCGTIFKISTSGQAALLHDFSGFDGFSPSGGLTLGADGNFYGTTFEGGSFGYGVLFKVTPAGSLTVLHYFNFDGTDGNFPEAPPILASDGNYYGTTAAGGTNNAGVVYKVTPAGAYSITYNLDLAIADSPIGPPTEGTDGNLYVAAYYRGTSVCGSLMKISTAGVLIDSYLLDCPPDGENPYSLIQASDGNFYGTTHFGGAYSGGVLFRLSQSFSYTVAHSFGASQTEGANPTGPAMQATDGNLYGLDRFGGNFGYGTIYRCALNGTCGTMHNWSSTVSAGGGIVQHTNGSLYGVTADGGIYGAGSVFSLDVGLKAGVALVLYRSKAGSTVQILGQGLTGTSSVSFNGVPATSFKVVRDTYMTAVVPSGATSGPVVVTTPTGVLRSLKEFQVIP
ncbi:MAG TPA: choice-of-anchor tandem repeat GloVer-containing protein [Candidatus Sulfotelmatobacter sp.]|nr:choice-of-anchor tandem repeat GloVer-containing protein [Candidatus Sulfotelmatobacter sp.]